MKQYYHAAAVTPSDSVPLTIRASAFVVGANGTVKVNTIYDTGVTLTCVAGFVYPLTVTKIYSTGTSATGIVGLW